MSLLVASFPNGGQAGIPYRDADELCVALSRLLSIPSDLHGNDVIWTCEPDSLRMPS